MSIYYYTNPKTKESVAFNPSVAFRKLANHSKFLFRYAGYASMLNVQLPYIKAEQYIDEGETLRCTKLQKKVSCKIMATFIFRIYDT